MVLPQHLGYGTYEFKTAYSVNGLDPNITFGAFTRDPYGLDSRLPSPHREIDFEGSRWSNASAMTNSQTAT